MGSNDLVWSSTPFLSNTIYPDWSRYYWVLGFSVC